MKPGLERVRGLLSLVGDPQEALNCVHVAGTNGKGSTCTMLAYGLSGAGHKTGLYTSPFVLDFRERIQIVSKGKAEMIPEEDLARIVTLLRPYAEETAQEHGDVTEFELITAAAFFWFAEQGVDICVLETGLGGRLDATNVIKEPLCSVITTVGLDHTDILGDTVAAIAAEKCGIIKENCPVVTTFLQPVDALDVIYDTCIKRSSPLAMPEERQVTKRGQTLTGSEIEYFGKRINAPFPGEHQIANCLTALTAAFVLRDKHGMSLHNDSFIAGLEKAKIPARQELLRAEPPLLLDGSHNPDGLSQLSATVKKFLTDLGEPKKGSLLVIGMLRDKDVRSSVSLITPYFERVLTVTPDSPRALTAEELADIIGGNAKAVTAAEAAKEAKENSGVSVVCGSLYLAGEIRPQLM